MEQTGEEIERELARRAGVHVAVEVLDNQVVLSGIVLSEGERRAALDIARDLAPQMEVVDDLEVEGVMPERIAGLDLDEADVGHMTGADPDTEDDESLEAGDFTDQELLRNPEGGAGGGSGGLGGDDEPSDGDEVWVPPTDPVRTADNQVLGGFGLSSMDSVRVSRSSDGSLGDEAIEDAVRRELREDAATTDLDIHVSVRNGTVHLRGSVPTLDDADNAEEVAGRVEGVIEVIEELDVSDLR